ncbi:hypothetical protein [Flavobacterium johnsoniae]|uniref:hypothetical protein n=1 Tax=Flavobacterium johnsoniae TaxID=986 RepID=UPI0011F01CE5|nr:hypothetical protein [Flavobacterium johnsoniae]
MKKLFFLLLIMLLSYNNTKAQTSGAAALIALDEIDATVSKQINSIDNLVTNAIGNSGNMILSMTARLKKDINETIGNTDKVLRENQQNLYNEILNLSSEFDKIVKERISDIDVISLKISQLANDFLVKKKEPNIFKFQTPPFIKDYTKEYTIKISGTSFDRSDLVAVIIGEKQFKPVQSHYGELVFKIDSSDIKPNLNETYLNAQVKFNYRKGIFKAKKNKTEPFIIQVVPLNIGSATVFFEQEKPERRYTELITFSCDCKTGASDWKGKKEKSTTPFNFNPSGGRLFDPSSIVVTNWYQRHGGGYKFSHQTEQQIMGNISCSSDGKPYGGGGHSTLTFGYKEFDIIYKIYKEKTTAKDISSVNPVLFELPDPIDGKRPNLSYVKILTYDSREIILTPSVANVFFKVNINPVTDDVIVRWAN